MKVNYKITLAVIGGFVLGAGAAASVLHPQGRAPTYVVAMVNVKDQDAYSKQFLPKVMVAIKENGGEYLAGGMNKTTSFAGEQPPKTFLVEMAQAWRKLAEHAAVAESNPTDLPISELDRGD
jgi:uncharacterized protein (DUF1330 family)